MTTAFIDTWGCVKRRLDANRIGRFVAENQWRLTDDFRKADVIFFGTCGVTDGTEEGSLEAIQRFESGRKRGSRIVVFGCLPAISPVALQGLPDTVVVDLPSLDRLHDILGTARPMPRNESAVLDNTATRRADDFADFVCSLRAANPDLTIRTDVICGFPGETEADFRNSMDLVERLGIEHVAPVVYSERPGARSFPADMQVPPRVRKLRLLRLHGRIARMRTGRLLTGFGRRFRVMESADGPRRSDAPSSRP